MIKKYTWLFLSIVAYISVYVLTFKTCYNYVSLIYNMGFMGFLKGLLPFIWNMFYLFVGSRISQKYAEKMIYQIIYKKEK